MLVAVLVASLWARERLETAAWSGLQATVQTVFDSHATVQGAGNGLSALVQRSGLERIWVVDATGRVVASSMRNDVGEPLDFIWWSAVREMGTGSRIQTIAYGRSELALVAIHDAAIGRYAVAVGPTPPIGRDTVKAGLTILGLSLILWIVFALATWFGVVVRLHRPLDELDKRMMSVVRGGDVSDAALDQTQARTESFVGGHAACTMDLARHARTNRGLAREAEGRFQGLFNVLPSKALIILNTGTVVAMNARLAAAMDVKDDVPVRSELDRYKDVMPVVEIGKWMQRLGSAPAGTDRAMLKDGRSLTIQPTTWHGDEAVLVLVDDPDGDMTMEVPESDWSRILETAGVCAVVFDEEGACLMTTPGLDARDLREFRNECLATEDDRNAFDAWMHERPDVRSQELTLARFPDQPLVWNASEITWQHGDAGVIWAVKREPTTS